MALALPDLDYAEFARELDELRARVEAQVAAESRPHLRSQARWGAFFSAFGYATSWIAPNPISAVSMALGLSARWTIVAHHTAHRALDRLPNVPISETSKGFAKGRRRWLDWFDWFYPEAWDYEHNKLHHYHTGEVSDPDLVEDQVARIRNHWLPRWVKLAVIAVYSFTWKFVYYAPSSYGLLRRERLRRLAGRPPELAGVNTDVDLVRAWSPLNADGRAFWREIAIPYIFLRVLLLPALFFPISGWAAFSVFTNTLLAELLTGLHTFVIVVPNHAGNDVHRFDRPPSDRAEFYVRQILGSVNYPTGGAVNDFLLGFLNYQIEHHLWPDLSPRGLQVAAPEVRALCARHGVPYIQESVFVRLRRLIEIMVGDRSMIQSETRGKHERESVLQSAK